MRNVYYMNVYVWWVLGSAMGSFKPCLVLVTCVCRYVPSQADVAVFDAISSPPSTELCHALRWYNHIKSYQREKTRCVSC